MLPARLQGAARYAELSENTLRVVPAAAGLLLVAAHVFLIPYIGFPAAFGAALLAAISPAMVYYSRYFIHETLFVLLTFCALLSAFRYRRRGGSGWAVCTGLCLAWMYATKETVIIACACMVLAAFSLVAVKKAHGEAPVRIRIPGRHLALAAAAGLVTAGLFFSSFLSHPAGIVDSVLAYRSYFWRGSGNATWHVHPWHYYLNLLLYFRAYGGPVWTEGMIVVLAAVGGVAAFRKGASRVDPDPSRFLALYTLLMVVVYCLCFAVEAAFLVDEKSPQRICGGTNGPGVE